MEEQQISKFHKFIKKMKHGLAEEDILNKNKFLEANEKYVNVLLKLKNIFFYLFTISFILLPMPAIIYKLSIPLFLFGFSLSTFFCFLIIKIEISKFNQYKKIREEDKDINLR